MDAGSSLEVLLTITVLTTVLLVAIRWVGTAASAHHNELPPLPTSAPNPARPQPGLDNLRLIAILTAAASEMLETENLVLQSVTDVTHTISELGHIETEHQWPRSRRKFFRSGYRPKF